VRVVVIGAGLGGLSAAAHLVRRGHQVTVLERDSVPGGRVGQLASEGFHIDTGPTILLMPNLLAETFAAAGRDMAQYLTIEPVDPMYRATFADGSELRVLHDREAMTEEIRRFANAREAGAFNEFCEWLVDLYQAQASSFIDTNFGGPWDVLRKWRGIVEIAKQGGFGRLDSKVASFFDDERLQRIFSYQTLLGGLSPKDALAMYAVVCYMDTVGGVYAPRGGMHTIASGLARATVDAGATIRYGAQVTRILRGGDNAVTGVEIGGSERIVADAVVCNADLPVAYRTLLGGTDAPRAARRGRYSPSCLLWVAGVRGDAPEGAARHNLHFGDQWDGAFKAIIKRGVRMTDPSVLVSMQSVGDPLAAPPVARRSTRSSPCPTSTARSTGGATVSVSPTICVAASRSSAIRPTWWSSARSTRSTGRRWGSNGARRSPSATRSANRVRSGRTTSTPGSPASCSPARRRCPASAFPSSCCRASSPRAGSRSTPAPPPSSAGDGRLDQLRRARNSPFRTAGESLYCSATPRRKGRFPCGCRRASES
jgi:phytoene desaturase